jgi:hypothetical protein
VNHGSWHSLLGMITKILVAKYPSAGIAVAVPLLSG